jgi:hypothetical protein
VTGGAWWEWFGYDRDGATHWLAKPPSDLLGWDRDEVAGRALVLGVMGRTSVEGDWLTWRVLESLDRMFARADPGAGEPPMHVGEWFELLGRFGVGGRWAIPRLNEFRKHPNAWARMWATEALSRIFRDQGVPAPLG